MTHRDATYERLRSVVSSIEKAPDHRNRKLVWATAEHTLALARDATGRVEVFVAGYPLAASIRVVAEVLEHQVWTDDDDVELAANRIVLPVGDHFDHFGALLCVELIDHGMHFDPQAAFSAVEPLISLALTREMVTDQTLIGLIGELAMLEQVLSAVQPGMATHLVRSWAGSTPSARDFQIEDVGVEVKTTQGAASIHHVEGVHQVELGHPNHGGVESKLFMLSLGIGWVADSDQGRSLPDIVESILALLPDPDSRADFLDRIKQYGGDAAVGYDHERDRSKPRCSTRFYFRFERLYDMSDDRLKLLTGAHLAELTNIDPGSVTFRVVLSDRVRGEHNPTNGWNAIVAKVLAAAGIVTL